MKNKTLSIVGFGRFGQALYKLIKNDFKTIVIYDPKLSPKDIKQVIKSPNTKIAEQIEDIYKQNIVIYAVPINQFEKVIKNHKKYITNKNILIDVLSVKTFPKQVFQKELKDKNVEILLTHPMFGPDSIRKNNGVKGFPMVMDKFTTSNSTYKNIKQYFQNKGIKIIEMSASEHDKLAANSQGLTHFLGRLLEEFKFKPTVIDTLGAKKLYEIMEQTCNDSWELFKDLQTYNPYTKQMRIKVGTAYDKLFNQLIPLYQKNKYITYGIQGGRGSFNEEALQHYLKENKISKFKIKYLYTTPNVLKALHRGDIDQGLFAIQNSVGGLVEESIEAMADYKFSITNEIKLPIRHFLMIKQRVDKNKITTIMAHPQVLKQCKNNLKKKYSKLKTISGSGELIDTAKAAYALYKGELPDTTAILGPKTLSNIFDLKIIDKDLQDDKKNITSFLLVQRKV